MSCDFIAMIRDIDGNGVLADRVEGWELSSGGAVRVHLAGGGSVDLRGITRQEFVERLDRALTAIAEAER